MYGQYPRATRIRLDKNGVDDSIKFMLDHDQEVYVPPGIDDFLKKHGWSSVGTHPDTDEQLYQNTNLELTNYGYYKWEQAVAFQMFLFMNIGPNP